MASILKQKMAETQSRSVGMAKAMSGGASLAGGNPLGLGNASNYGIGSKRTDLTQHTEQYRHNQGWVSASIGPIAKRVARQPIYIARVKSAANAKAMPSYGQKSTSYGRAVKPWEPRKETAQSIWLKRHLPGTYKQLASTADVLDSHPMLDAIEDPNPIMVRWSLLFVTVASLLLTGKAYWWIQARDRDGDSDEAKKTPRIEIWPLPSNWVKPVHTEKRLYDSWEVTPDGALEPTPVPAEQIVYFYFPDPSTPLGAMSTLQTCARAVVSDEAIAEAQRRAFANGVYPGVAVVVGRQPDVDGAPGDRPALNREQRAQIITAFKQAYRGVYNADEPIILDQIIQDVKRVTNTNREMDFMNSGDYTKARITQTFGVNPIVMGQVEGANRASSATADDHLCQSTVNPIIELISEILTAWLNPLFAAPGEKLVMFIEEAHAVDPDSDRQDYDLLQRAGAVSKNELRAGLRNLPPMVDGDTALVQGGLMEIDARLASEAQGAANPAKPIGGEGSGDDGSGGGGGAPKPLAPANPNGGTGSGDGTQNSEPPQTPVPPAAGTAYGRIAAKLVDALGQMGARGTLASVAKAVLESAFATVPPAVVYRLVDALSVDGRLVPLEADGIAAVVACVKQVTEPVEEVTLAVTPFAQEVPYDCGGAAGWMAANFCGCAPASYADFISEVHTAPEFGTHADDLLTFFAHHGCNPRDRDHATLNYLRANLRAGRLCLCAVQYFGDGDASGGEGGASSNSGHWIVVNGYTREGIKYVCPIDGPGEIANGQFLGNWYDQDQDGTPMVRYVLSVAPMPGVERSTKTGRKLVDSSGHEHAADGKFGRGGGSAKPKPDDHGSGAGGGDKPPHAPLTKPHVELGSVADKPEEIAKKAEGFLGKIKEAGGKAVAVAKRVGEKMKQLAVTASYHAMTKNLADDICDTAHDYSKLINAKGTGDWLSTHLGVSGNFAAKVSSIVLSYGLTKLKEHMARRYQASLMLPTKPPKGYPDVKADDDVQAESVDSLTIAEAAQHINDIVCGALEAMGCPAAELPSVKDTEEWLVDRHDELLGGDDEGDAAQNSESDADDAPKRMSAYHCKAHRLSTKERTDLWLAAHESSERELEGVLLEFFNTEASRIVAGIGEALKSLTDWRLADVTEFKGTDDAPEGDDADPALGKLLDRLVPLGTMTNRLRLAVRPCLEAVAVTGAAQENDALQPMQRAALEAWEKAKKPVDRKPLAKPIRKRVNAYLDDMVNDPYWQDVNKTTRTKVARAVRRGLANNESVESIKKRVQAVLAPLNNANRATMIARTEATAALNIGFQAAREHYGSAFVKGKQWTCSAVHHNVRPTHEKANGQFRKNGSKFRVGGVWCEYPGDPALPPAERCNCRCVALTIPAD